MSFDFNAALIASLAAPVLGAMLYPALHNVKLARKIFDYIMVVAVPLLVLGHIAYHAWPGQIVVALLLVLGGLLFPLLLERMSSAFASKTDNIALAAGISGFAVHVILESAVLGVASTDLVLAIVLHRMVVGLMIYWLVEPEFGFLIGALAVGAILVATLVGYFLFGSLLLEDSHTADYYQFFVSGSLLHVIFHRSIRQHKHDNSHDGH